MSSIPEKSLSKTSSPSSSSSSSLSPATTSNILEKRSFFLRTSSIQKIKCSATYPFRLAGMKFSKDAIKQLFETLIIKARIMSQKAFIDLLIATFKLVGVLISLWIGTPNEDVCDNSKKTENVLSFHERLREKIQKLQKHKQRFELLKAKDLIMSSSSSSPSSSSSSLTNATNFQSFNKLFSLKCNGKIYKFENNIAKLRKTTLTTTNSTTELINNQNNNISSTLSSLFDIKNENDKIENDNEPKKNYLLAFLVYSSAIFIYLQLLILAVALNTTQNIPPGLLFLITSLILIAVIVFKVFLIEKSDKIEMKLSTKQTTEKTDELSSSTNQSTTKRQTRTKYRKTPMMIDLNSKTLSKIKIL